MSAEKIIEQIKKDSEKEIKQIQLDAEKQRKEIITQAKKEGEAKARKILENGKKTIENQKKIQISKANQESKKEIMKAKEELIEECFIKAQQKLSQIKGKEYETLVKKLIKEGVEKLGKNCTIIASREVDKKIAEQQGLKVAGKTDAAGGVILKSADGKITLDYTLDGILKREKQKIRIKVGKLLFS
ncbi:MAG: hypothetical protein DRM99_01835 [Thermoplasmata archaeon]|nr:MAG: hypothetical protein DRM99_01835 [Thermoplasmata archaeon]